MYKIVNYEENWSYPVMFFDFNNAFMIQQISYPDSLIEYWMDDDNPEVVWNPGWEQNYLQ